MSHSRAPLLLRHSIGKQSGVPFAAYHTRSIARGILVNSFPFHHYLRPTLPIIYTLIQLSYPIGLRLTDAYADGDGVMLHFIPATRMSVSGRWTLFLPPPTITHCNALCSILFGS
jgi:hypothetical protein